MNEPIEFYDRIINTLGVLPETADLKRYESYNQFMVLEGEDSNTGIEVKFLIYNCSREDLSFNKDEYKKVIEQVRQKSFIIPVMIFEDLDKESKIRTSIYNGLGTANERKLFNKYFDEKIPLYTKAQEKIYIEVEKEGINFLEYNTNGEVNYLNGYIYNVSIWELKEVFNVTGSKLFHKNVRVGLNNKTGKKLKKAFKDYIKVGMYNEFIKIKELEGKKDDIMENLGIEPNHLKISAPDKFWFFHNGVTIFYYNETKINRSNNRIELVTNKISIINGAQTVSNFYHAINELKSECMNLINELKISQCSEEWLEDILTNVCRKIKIKTIIIDGLDEYVKKISEGLNTQIPIEEEHILATSEEVEEMNKILKSRGISITRDGEVSAESNLSVLEYIKKYLIIIGKPGESKNLDKTKIKKLLIDSTKAYSDNDFVSKLKILLILDEWWRNIRYYQGFINDENKSDIEYYKYGKNYFGSYLVSKEIEQFDEENLYNLFNQFIKEFKTIQPKVDLEDFKDDVLYDKYLEQKNLPKEEIDEISKLGNINKVDLCEFINKNIKSRYAVSKIVAMYLANQNISIPYFRVIAVTKDTIKEGYPFPSSTFTELYQTKDEEQNVAHIEYKDSQFAKEINKEFPVFVVRWKEDKGNSLIDNGKVEYVYIIKKFSFKDYEESAKQVFDITKEAFEKGDESIFTKSSEKRKFHIRPKAINSEDTFEFSNGMQITKRTFWANKETVNQIIQRYGEKDEDDNLNN